MDMDNIVKIIIWIQDQDNIKIIDFKENRIVMDIRIKMIMVILTITIAITIIIEWTIIVIMIINHQMVIEINKFQ